MTFQVQDIRSNVLNKRPEPNSLLNGQTAINYNGLSPGLFFRTGEGNLAKVGPTLVSPIAPVAFGYEKYSKGEMWYDTLTNILKIWNGSAWGTPGIDINIQPATRSSLGSVIVGDGLLVSDAGVISTSATALTPATTTTLGGVKISTGLTVTSDGTLSVEPATTLALGAIKVGSGLAITSDGVLSNTNGTAYVLPTATSNALGGVKVGSGLSVDGTGLLTADNQGGVTSVTAGTGLETNPSVGITTSGTVALSNTTVVAGTYTHATVDVDSQGRITSAQDGTSVVNFEGTTDVTGTAPSAIAGDFYLNLVLGAASASWTGIVGTQIQVNQFVFYTSNNVWAIGGASDVSAYVTIATAQNISGAKTFQAEIQCEDIDQGASATAYLTNVQISGTLDAELDDGTF